MQNVHRIWAWVLAVVFTVSPLCKRDCEFFFLGISNELRNFYFVHIFYIITQCEKPISFESKVMNSCWNHLFCIQKEKKKEEKILHGFSCVNGFLWKVMIACCVVWFIWFVVEDKDWGLSKKMKIAEGATPTFEISFYFLLIFLICFETCNEKIEFIEKYERSTIYLCASDARNVWCCMGHVTFKVKHYLWIILFRGGKCLTAAYNFAASFTERCIVDFYPTRFFLLLLLFFCLSIYIIEKW